MINKSLKFIILSFALVGTIQSEIFKMRESPIRTRISSKQLNRISLKNDRIESITGMEEAFQFEKNEKTGDGYIKPTEANGNEPIAISLTTTSGRTQELILNVDEGEPNTIVLENVENSEDLEDFLVFFGLYFITVEVGLWISIMYMLLNILFDFLLLICFMST